MDFQFIALPKGLFSRVTQVSPDIWTTRKLLVWMRQAFTKAELDSPGLMAEMLLAHVIGCDRIRLHMEADRPAAPAEREALRGLVGRALKNEPVQYLTGEGWFYGLAFKVDKRVLIPRPGTSTIVDAVLGHSRVTPGFGGTGTSAGEGVLIADLCTGSGCIAATLLKNLPGARAVATDISEDALVVARENAVRHKVETRVEFARGDLFAGLAGHPVASAVESLQYLVSNPPYIPDHEWDAVGPNVKDHEPHLALRGGKDGLDFLRRILKGGPELLKHGGMLAVEIADSTAEAALALAKGTPGLVDARVVNDFEGLARVVVAMKA